MASDSQDPSTHQSSSSPGPAVQPQRPHYSHDFTTLPSLTDLDLTPMNYSETMRDVADAINNADTALRNAREAFRNGSSVSRHSIVDLTGTSPVEDNDDTFISRTRHPHDSSRGRVAASTSLHEPAYGPGSSPPSTFTDIYNSITSDPNTHAPPRPLQPSRWYGPIAVGTMPPRRDTTRRAEETAIRRQRQLHRDWQRVQDRNRRRAEEQAAREAEVQSERETARLRQALEQEEARPTTTTTTTTNTNTNTNTANDPSRTRRRRRLSDASTNFSISDMSDFSIDTASSMSHSNQNPADTDIPMASIDLTHVDSDKTLSQVLAKEQQDAIASQNNTTSSTSSSNPKATAFSSYKCAICMDSPTDATTTKCGHLFCHRCVVDALKHSKSTRSQEAQAHGRRGVQSGLCPVCRTPLHDKDSGPSRGLIPIEIKKVPRALHEKRQKDKNREKDATTTSVDKGKEKAKDEPDLNQKDAPFTPEENDDFISLDTSSKARLSKTSRKGKRKRPLTDEELDLDQELFGEAVADIV